MTQAERLNKEDALAHWHGLASRSVPTPSQSMQAIPYGHTGSTYAQDTLRFTGSRGFIDSMLATLQPLLGRENGFERIQITYGEATDRESDEPLGSWVCYIQVHRRGREKKDLPSWTYAYRASNPFKNGRES